MYIQMRKNPQHVERTPIRDTNALISAATLSLASLTLIGDVVLAGSRPSVVVLALLTLSALAATLVLHARRG
jgi:hypothetical protein